MKTCWNIDQAFPNVGMQKQGRKYITARRKKRYVRKVNRLEQGK